MKDIIDTNINNLNSLRDNVALLERIDEVISLLTSTLKQGLPLLVCGNGGSASDALHITGELVGRFNFDRQPLNVICLNSNITVITAWANDVSYDSVFSRQVEAHGVKGGVLWGLSTSGNSKNVVQAFKIARNIGMKTIAFTGEAGGELASISDYLINVPSNETPRIQELHIMLYHFICANVEINMKKIKLQEREP